MAVTRYRYRQKFKGDLPPPFFWALLRVMGASGGPLVLLQVKKGAFITARELSHRKVWTDLFTQQMLIEREPSLLVLVKLPCACSVASLVLGMQIIANVSFATTDCFHIICIHHESLIFITEYQTHAACTCAKWYREYKLDFDGSNSRLRGATRQKGKLASGQCHI